MYKKKEVGLFATALVLAAVVTTLTYMLVIKKIHHLPGKSSQNLSAWQRSVEQALQKYEQALQTCGNKRDNFFPVPIMIDKQWLQERLQKPFAW